MGLQVTSLVKVTHSKIKSPELEPDELRPVYCSVPISVAIPVTVANFARLSRGANPEAKRAILEFRKLLEEKDGMQNGSELCGGISTVFQAVKRSVRDPQWQPLP
jgi:hypothetical protein